MKSLLALMLTAIVISTITWQAQAQPSNGDQQVNLQSPSPTNCPSLLDEEPEEPEDPEEEPILA